VTRERAKARMLESIFKIEKIETLVQVQTPPDGCEFCQYCTQLHQAFLYRKKQRLGILGEDLAKPHKKGET
jgi:hypothetical protein